MSTSTDTVHAPCNEPVTEEWKKPIELVKIGDTYRVDPLADDVVPREAESDDAYLFRRADAVVDVVSLHQSPSAPLPSRAYRLLS